MILNYYRDNNCNGKISNLKLFAEVYHDLCDALDKINSVFTVHLITMLLSMLIIDIFTAYGFARHLFWNISENSKEVIIFSNSFYLIFHLMLKSSISDIGHTTRAAGEGVRTMVAKVTNDQPNKSEMRLHFHDILIQFQTRNLKLRNIFFVIDWNIVLAVSKIIMFID